jgi:hypothetical protein
VHHGVDPEQPLEPVEFAAPGDPRSARIGKGPDGEKRLTIIGHEHYPVGSGRRNTASIAARRPSLLRVS